MSFVTDHVRTIDARLDSFQLSQLPSVDHDRQSFVVAEEARSPAISSRLTHLQELTKSLSSTSSGTSSLCTVDQCISILQKARLSTDCSTCHHFELEYAGETASQHAPDSAYEHELEWFLVSKATVQVYGLVLNSLINETIPFSDELWHWNNVLGSYQSLGLYSLQTSPLRFWDWTRSIYREVRQRETTVSQGWSDFYRLVRNVVHDRSIADIQRRVATPLTLLQTEIRQKTQRLDRARTMNANAIGFLLSNTFKNESFRSKYHVSSGANVPQQASSWKGTILSTIAVLDAVLLTASERDLTHEEFDDMMTTRMNADPLEGIYQASLNHNKSTGQVTILLKPAEVANRLQQLLQDQLPLFTNQSGTILRNNGKPSFLIRYWLPATLFLISSSTIYRYVINRKAAILDSIRDLGRTVLDFWKNWVIEPVINVIRTIRHDADSEVSIMSKGSLIGDRASLERMVVDFVKDNPPNGPLDDAALEVIRSNVREGDLTTVLRVYEAELKHPIRGGLMGNLVRALLIQVQKTKVDVEVAMGGIDSLLKSQELVFGFIALTPGMLVTFSIVRWLSALPGSRRNARSGQKRAQAYQILRNIDRLLTASPQPNQGNLSSHEHGLLVCEAVTLRNIAERTFPRTVFRDFLQDFDDLIDVESGVGRQLRVIDRIRWAYAKWL